jgi:hypothetical protein
MKHRIVEVHPHDAYVKDGLVGTILSRNSLVPSKNVIGFWEGKAFDTKGKDYYFFAVKIEPVVTDWFPADVKPVHVGVYEKNYRTEYDIGHDKPEYQYWDGTNWYYGSRDVEETAALFKKGNSVAFYPRQWRGVQE